MHNSFCPFGRFCLIWLMGFGLGILAAAQAAVDTVSLMRLSFSGRVSIVLLLRCLLPFLIAAIAVMIHSFQILPVLIWLRSFFFGFFLQLCIAAFGSGSWLAIPLFCIPELVCAVSFCLLMLVDAKHFWRSFWICIVLVFAAVILDHCAVSPLRAVLLYS